MGNSFSRRAISGIVTTVFWGVVTIAAAVAPFAEPRAIDGSPAVSVAAETPARTDTPGNGWGG